jgi:SAM-dependent methyltransferase
MATETPLKQMVSTDKAWLEERIKRVRSLIKNILGEIEDGKTLDVAMGKWSLVKALYPELYVVGIDNGPPVHPPNEFYFVNLKRMSLPFSDSEFSFVFAGEIVEHLGFVSVRNLLSEILRVLRPGGYLLLTTPNGARNRLKDILGHPHAVGHEKEFTVAELESLVEGAGFEIVHSEGIQPVFIPWRATTIFASVKLPGFLSSQLIYLCRKAS